MTTMCIKQTVGHYTHSGVLLYSLPNLASKMDADTKNTLCLWTNASEARGDLCLTARIKERASQLRLKENRFVAVERSGSRFGTWELYREC